MVQTLEEQLGGIHRLASGGSRDLQEVYSMGGSIAFSRFSKGSRTPNQLRTTVASGLDVRRSGH